MMDEVKDISEFSDADLKEEFEARFGAPENDETTLDDFETSELLEELQDRGRLPGEAAPDKIDEMSDLVAQAALESSYAQRAYALMFDAWPDEVLPLKARQNLIRGRMGEAA